MYATIPVYYPSLEEAARKDEAALWCDSYNINMSCRNFIQDKAMTAFNTRELDAFIEELVRCYGTERAMYVLSRMAIVVSSLTDQTVDPPTMAEWAYQNGYWCSGNGSYHSLIPGAAEGFGLQWESISTDDPQAVVDALASGKLIVALMSKGHFTSSGHFMVLRGVTSEGKILVADPASKKRSEQEWDISIILDEARKGAAAGGPLWAIY